MDGANETSATRKNFKSIPKLTNKKGKGENKMNDFMQISFAELEKLHIHALSTARKIRAEINRREKECLESKGYQFFIKGDNNE
ncbi:MAG: hypothetical protein WC389_20125 [Lutibacter sp.]|jgi:hypothetical protein